MNFLRVSVAAVALLWGSEAYAACTNPIPAVDKNGATVNLEAQAGPGTNCVPENVLVQGGALVSTSNGLFVQPGAGATFVLGAGTNLAGKVGIDQTTPGTTNGVIHNLSSAGATAATPTSASALAANQIIKASGGNLFSFTVSADSTLSAAAWWIMIYNAATAPIDGAVTPLKCYAMPSGATGFAAAFPNPVSFSTGITIGVSTTGCFNKTASTHAFISGDAL